LSDIASPSADEGVSAWVIAPFLVAAAAFALVLYFDVQTKVAFGDEWVYRWIVQHAAATHHLVLWPAVNAANLVQYSLSIPAALSSSDPRWLRLTVLPWMPITSFYSWRLARRLGADPFLSAIAATMLACSPIYLSIATGFLSDPAYLALLSASAWYGLVWAETGHGIAPMVLAAGLATLQRQYGVGLALAMTVALAYASRKRRMAPHEWIGLAAVWAAVVIAIFSLPLTGLSTPEMSHSLSKVAHPNPAAIVGSLVAVPPMLGLLLLPIGFALWAASPVERNAQSRWQMLPTALALAAVCAGVVFTFRYGTDIFPGGTFGRYALGPIFLRGDKPALWPLPLYIALEVAVTVTYLIILVRRRKLWTPASLGIGGVWLVCVAAGQLLLIPATIPGDKYYLGLLAPLIPLAAARARRPDAEGGPISSSLRAAVVLLMAAGVGFYAIGQQDRIAWENATDIAARRAYESLTPLQVDAGYEANGTYLGVPAFEATRHLPAGVDYVFVSPPHPSVSLLFAGPADPRPGVAYQSVMPGKVVIQPTGKR
jgi:hypothetical protein